MNFRSDGPVVTLEAGALASVPPPGPASLLAARLEERRAVLVRPGDLLIVGNAGHLEPEQFDALDRFGADLFRVFGIRVAVFEADVDLDLLPGGAAAVEPAVEDCSGG